MFVKIQDLLKQKNVLHHANEGIEICLVKDSSVGVDLAASILQIVADSQSTLYLSGGKTPKELYKRLADSEIDGGARFAPGAVGMVDERFGEKLHEKSNELMLKEAGLLRYFDMLNIAFYPILQTGTREDTAEAYDEKIRSLNAVFKRSIAVLGVGVDGHTAGVAPNRTGFKNPIFDPSQKHLLVSEFNDAKGMFKERVTMTFLGLSMMDLLLVLVFGADKKQALELLFRNGSEEDIPARFYKRPEIAGKTIIITDQT